MKLLFLCYFTCLIAIIELSKANASKTQLSEAQFDGTLFKPQRLNTNPSQTCLRISTLTNTYQSSSFATFLNPNSNDTTLITLLKKEIKKMLLIGQQRQNVTFEKNNTHAYVCDTITNHSDKIEIFQKNNTCYDLLKAENKRLMYNCNQTNIKDHIKWCLIYLDVSIRIKNATFIKNRVFNNNNICNNVQFWYFIVSNSIFYHLHDLKQYFMDHCKFNETQFKQLSQILIFNTENNYWYIFDTLISKTSFQIQQKVLQQQSFEIQQKMLQQSYESGNWGNHTFQLLKQWPRNKNMHLGRLLLLPKNERSRNILLIQHKKKNNDCCCFFI